MARVKKKTAVKGKKKTWFEVRAPTLFNDQVIAEVPTFEKSLLVGKKITVNLMNLTNDPRNQGMAVSFTISSLAGEVGITEMSGYTVLPATLKRMVRRGKDRLDRTLKLRTKDNALIMLKPLVLTRTNTIGSVKRALRKKMHTYLRNYALQNDLAQIQQDIVQNKMQREMFNELKKLYPVAISKIRDFRLLTKDADSYGFVEEEVVSDEEESSEDEMLEDLEEEDVKEEASDDDDSVDDSEDSDDEDVDESADDDDSEGDESEDDEADDEEVKQGSDEAEDDTGEGPSEDDSDDDEDLEEDSGEDDGDSELSDAPGDGEEPSEEDEEKKG